MAVALLSISFLPSGYIFLTIPVAIVAYAPIHRALFGPESAPRRRAGRICLMVLLQCVFWVVIYVAIRTYQA